MKKKVFRILSSALLATAIAAVLIAGPGASTAYADSATKGIIEKEWTEPFTTWEIDGIEFTYPEKWFFKENVFETQTIYSLTPLLSYNLVNVLIWKSDDLGLDDQNQEYTADFENYMSSLIYESSEFTGEALRTLGERTAKDGTKVPLIILAGMRKDERIQGKGTLFFKDYMLEITVNLPTPDSDFYSGTLQDASDMVKKIIDSCKF